MKTIKLCFCVKAMLLSTRLWTQAELLGQAGSELFNVAEVKTRKSGNTAEVQKSGRQFSSVLGIKQVTHWESLREKQTAGALTSDPGRDRKVDGA